MLSGNVGVALRMHLGSVLMMSGSFGASFWDDFHGITSRYSWVYLGDDFEVQHGQQFDIVGDRAAQKATMSAT